MKTKKSLGGAALAALLFTAAVFTAAVFTACELDPFSAGSMGGDPSSRRLMVLPKRTTYSLYDNIFLPDSDAEVYVNSPTGVVRSISVRQAEFYVAESDINPVFRELQSDSSGEYFAFSNLGEARIKVRYDGLESIYTVFVSDPSGGDGSGGGGGTGTGGGIIIVGP
jgi:hypothetical protein